MEDVEATLSLAQSHQSTARVSVIHEPSKALMVRMEVKVLLGEISATGKNTENHPQTILPGDAVAHFTGC